MVGSYPTRADHADRTRNLKTRSMILFPLRDRGDIVARMRILTPFDRNLKWFLLGVRVRHLRQTMGHLRAWYITRPVSAQSRRSLVFARVRERAARIGLIVERDDALCEITEEGRRVLASLVTRFRAAGRRGEVQLRVGDSAHLLQCAECGHTTMFSHVAVYRAGGTKCERCGSRWLDPLDQATKDLAVEGHSRAGEIDAKKRAISDTENCHIFLREGAHEWCKRCGEVRTESLGKTRCTGTLA